MLGGFRNTRPDRGVGVWQDGAPAEKDVVAAEHLLHGLGFFHESGGTDRGARGGSLTIDQAWTGIIGWSMDGLPFVGPWERRGGSQGGVGGAQGLTCCGPLWRLVAPEQVPYKKISCCLAALLPG